MAEDQMPPQPKTQQLPALTDRALLEDLSRVVKEGFKTQGERLDNIERQVDIAIEDNKQSNKRLTTLEVRLDESEKRADANSMFKRQASGVDLKHEAAIAELHTKVDAVDKKVDTVDEKTDAQTVILKEMLEAGKSIFKNPFVRALGVAIATALAAKYGIKILP